MVLSFIFYYNDFFGSSNIQKIYYARIVYMLNFYVKWKEKRENLPAGRQGSKKKEQRISLAREV